MDNNGEIGIVSGSSHQSMVKALGSDGISLLHNLKVDKHNKMIGPELQKPAFLFVYWEECGHCHRALGQILMLHRKVKEFNKQSTKTKYHIYAADLMDQTNQHFYNAMKLVGVPWFATISSSGQITPFKGNRVAECPRTQEKGNECISFWDSLSETQ